ncbi:hypothetical protein [Calidithermus roseus]|uniref:Uncharacterized protein n=1 Tax=Calidithermus roseus TaxID=1644118 RepID=A0A399EGR6_9DEIN|nr:hypothetical protein [Calidithermus roseus]RIH82773.1 hypothetical protein Mrose_03276 [Calidithermus roseus]
MNTPATAPPSTASRIAQALANLEAWLQTMRQPGGYAGPVAHWWSNRFRYTGPGLDWRYEGILAGYALLREKTGETRCAERLARAAADLIQGQNPDGSYRASRFELNPGPLGTPHEAAATLGLLLGLKGLPDPAAALRVARRNLDALIARLYSPEEKAFRDRVPNKLCTLAQALLAYAEASGEEPYLEPARAALEQALRYQVRAGFLKGAIHQYAPTPQAGDGRFFPYYQARCVPPLAEGARVLGEGRYLEAAHAVLEFLERSREGANWPMVLYPRGRRDARRFLAGMADVLLAYRRLGRPLPPEPLGALLAAQYPSGGFPTFFMDRPDHRAAVAVVGWNDKVFRLLAELLPSGTPLPAAQVAPAEVVVWIEGREARMLETPEFLRFERRGATLYEWAKPEPWARVLTLPFELR